MLGRPPAGEDGDPQPRHQGGGPGPDVVVPKNLPDGDRHRRARRLLRAAGRVLRLHDPVLIRVGDRLRHDARPEARGLQLLDVRPLCARLVTSGTVAVVGPFETLSVIVVRGAWNVSGAGLWSMTMPFGSSDSTSFLNTANPRASRVEFADSNV